MSVAIRQKSLRSHCPINFGLEVFGDKWSLLIVRDIVFFNKRTYNEFLASKEKIATNILANRLERLKAADILKCTRCETDKRSEIYSLTEKGLNLIPVLLEISYWGAQSDPGTAASQSFVKAYKRDKTALANALQNRLRRDEPINNNSLHTLI